MKGVCNLPPINTTKFITDTTFRFLLVVKASSETRAQTCRCKSTARILFEDIKKQLDEKMYLLVIAALFCPHLTAILDHFDNERFTVVKLSGSNFDQSVSC